MNIHLQSDLNWNLLRMFYVIAKEQGITKAAKRLGLSQPSVSSALRKLETQLQCQLVIRDSRHFELTTRGTRIYQECRDIFQSAERISHLVGDDDIEDRPQLRYQIASNLVSPMIDGLFRQYHESDPTAVFQGEVRNSQSIVHAIQQGQATLGFCLLVRPLDNLPSIRMFRREFDVFCGKGHRLFGQSGLTIRDLQAEPLISYGCATDGPDLEPLTLLRGNMQLGERVNGISTNFEELRRMVAAGLGIGLLPRKTVEDDVARGDLWPLTLETETIGADVYLVHAPRERLTPTDRAFVEMALEVRAHYPDIA